MMPQHKDEIITHTLNYLSLVTGNDEIRIDSKSFNKHEMYNLIEAGHTYSDFKRVIDNKWNQWKGSQFEQYVRPSTLFGKNFQKYLNEQSTSENKLAKLNSSVQRAKSANWRLDKK